MAKVIFSLDGNVLGEFELDKERIKIGRRPSNDIHIDNLAVSGEHAMIVTIGKDSFVEDLNSTNGTMLNKKAIKRQVLHHGDVIEFGKYRLQYINETQLGRIVTRDELASMKAKSANSNSAPPKEQVIADRYKGLTAPEQPKPVLPVESPVLLSGKLEVLSGENAGQTMSLNKSMTRLGTPGKQVAVITKRSNGFFVAHVEGEQLPQINGRSINPQGQILTDGDQLVLMNTQLKFSIDKQ